jgi:hypothetical protein
MGSYQCQSPVLFLFFNRPDTALRIFERIREAKPPRVYLACDGARDHAEGEAEKVAALRQRILSMVDWNCLLETRFLDANAGCGKAVSGAITWFFESVEAGIILEDDCLPCPSFFNYCDAMLERYRDDERVASVSGSNVFEMDVAAPSGQSYYFSRYPLMWGWASWRRAWKHYEFEVEPLPLSFYKKNGLGGYFLKDRFNDFLLRIQAGALNTWDFQWMVAVWRQSALTVTPARNLIQNIGFGEDATHTATAGGHSRLSVAATVQSVDWSGASPLTVCQQYDKRVIATWFNASMRAYLWRNFRRLVHCFKK